MIARVDLDMHFTVEIWYITLILLNYRFQLTSQLVLTLLDSTHR
jgi:hypothetical protein